MKVFYYYEVEVCEDLENEVQVMLTRLADMPPLKRYVCYEKVVFETALSKDEIRVFEWYMSGRKHEYEAEAYPTGCV